MPYELKIIKRYEFSSNLQRMSVITKREDESYFKVYSKGSPEKIKELCIRETIPSNFENILKENTMKGYRVIALAFKLINFHSLDLNKIRRNQVECNMFFLGFTIFQNKIKENSKSSIEKLKRAEMKLYMATGDNIITAISVAKECSLIDDKKEIYQLELNNEDNRKKLEWCYVDDNSYESDVYKSQKTNNIIIRKKSSFRSIYISTDKIENTGISLMKKYYSLHLIGFESPSKKKINKDVNKNESFILEKENLIDNHSVTSKMLNINMQKFEKEIMNKSVMLAITGSIFEELKKLNDKFLKTNNNQLEIYKTVYDYVIDHCYVYARMTPMHKAMLIEALQKGPDNKVLMCGDGANDCSALKAADVGVSLSVEEASIAAPFTSYTPQISCIETILIEGKASLATTVECFKFMMLYSIIQFSCVTILNTNASSLFDNQFLASDIFIIFPVAILIAKTGSSETLTSDKPHWDLKSYPIFGSILSQGIIQIIIQLIPFFCVFRQTWYVPANINPEDKFDPSYENTVII